MNSSARMQTPNRDHTPPYNHNVMIGKSLTSSPHNSPISNQNLFRHFNNILPRNAMCAAIPRLQMNPGIRKERLQKKELCRLKRLVWVIQSNRILIRTAQGVFHSRLFLYYSLFDVRISLCGVSVLLDRLFHRVQNVYCFIFFQISFFLFASADIFLQWHLLGAKTSMLSLCGQFVT